MLQLHKSSRGGIKSVLDDPRVRQVTHEGKTLYNAADLLAVLSDGDHAIDAWELRRSAHPQVAEQVIVTAPSGDMLDLEGVFRLIQSMDGTSRPRIQRLQNQIAAAARERFDEADDPEVALLRTRHAYEQQGRSRQWIA